MPIIDGFNPELSRDARDEALGRVDAAAPADWKVRAREAVLTVARRGRPFTTDDVWQILSMPPEPRALGAIMMQLAREKLIRPLATYERSGRVACHSRPLRTWEQV